MGKNKMNFVTLCFYKDMGERVLYDCANMILSAFKLLDLILLLACHS